MNPGDVRTGNNATLKLERALLIYRGAGNALFSTVHDVVHGKRAPSLREGQLLTMSFLATLAEGLGSRLAPEFLPPSVVCRTPHLICWWSPAQLRTMFFRSTSKLFRVNGRKFPTPALLWRLSGRELHVRALASDERPTHDTKLFVAPFWNTNNEGLVCQGSMARPDAIDANTIDLWAQAYFASEFTHDYGAIRLTRHPRGFDGLWVELAGKKSFPPEYLQPAKQSAEEFIRGSNASDPA